MHYIHQYGDNGKSLCLIQRLFEVIIELIRQRVSDLAPYWMTGHPDLQRIAQNSPKLSSRSLDWTAWRSCFWRRPGAVWGARLSPWPPSKQEYEHNSHCAANLPQWQENYEEKLVILSLGTPKHDTIIRSACILLWDVPQSSVPISFPDASILGATGGLETG